MTEQQQLCGQEASYLRLKESVKRTYPEGWFVAIADDQVSAAACSFRDLESELRAKGLDPRKVLVVEVGKDYPAYVTLLAGRLRP